MHTNSLNNLQPWQAGQSGNPAGRKQGSKNVANIVRELLEQDVDTNLLSTKSLATLTSGKPKTYVEAITLTLFAKALEGNVQAARLVFDTVSGKNTPDSDESSFFNRDKLVVEVVQSPQSAENQ